MTFTCGCRGTVHDPDCWTWHPARTSVAPEVWDVAPVDYNQDALDGAALRRLREALPWLGMVELYGPREDGRYLVQVWNSHQSTVQARREGSTIAEAADKCREALG